MCSPWRRLAALALVLLYPSLAVAKDRINVLLITVDTFRPDRLSAYGHTRKTSPVLDRLAADGALFEQAISSSSWTTPGLLSVLTGQWAPTHGVDVRGKSLSPDTPTFATELAKDSYAVPDILYLSSIPNLSNLGLTRSYVDRDTYLPNGDEVLFRALEAYQDSTFFIYYHYRNLHLPFDPTEPFDTLYTKPGFDTGFAKQRVASVRTNVMIPMGSLTLEPKDSVWVRALYDGQIREMDETFFRPLVETLKRLDLYERTMVIVTADHGEELLEHGFIGHPSTSFKGSAFDELVRIPLIMTCPALIPANTRVSMQVQNVDILPTVLDLLGRPIPETVQGRSLRPLFEGASLPEVPAYTETTPGGYQATPEMMRTRVRAMRTSRWKLIHTHGPDVDAYGLYDLRADPGEHTNLYDARPTQAARMRADLHTWALASREARAMVPVSPAEGPAHTGPLRVTHPADGDTLHYRNASSLVEVTWTGTVGTHYRVAYRVGEGAYHLEGAIPATGPVSRHGPFTEEMWNMLALYNPFAIRVTTADSSVASEWVTFNIAPTGEGTVPWYASVGISARFAVAEATLLVTGVGLSVLDLVAALITVPASLSIWLALVIVLAGSLTWPWLSRLGPERLRAWSVFSIYTLFIYVTLPVMPTVWGALFKHTQGRIDYAGSIAVAGAGLWIIVSLVRRRTRASTYGLLIPLVGIYIYLLMKLNTSPAERFHLAEYGLLSAFAYRALRLSRRRSDALVLGWILASLAGAIDEGIQWVIPQRIFEWKDIGLNAVSSALGMAIVAVFTSSGSRHDA